MPSRLVTRFAPSPTGYLHLGHVASMAFVFGLAALADAQVLLRMEDHDAERCRPEYEQAILDDMAWLGFVPANWALFSSVLTPNDYRQSNCVQFYQAALETLDRQNLIYACACTRKQLVAAVEGMELRYPGFCRHKMLSLAQGQSIRYRLHEQTESFDDLRLGTVEQHPFQQCGDFVLKDRRGYFSYHLAVVVDDMRHGVNWIIRGEDILSCTGRQLALARSLGQAKQALYFHHPLIVDAAGKKLSKRTFAEGVIHRRARGESAAAVLGEALHLVGLLPQRLDVKVDELPKILTEKGYTSI